MIAKSSGHVHGNRETSKARLISHLKYIHQHGNHEHSRQTRDDRRIFSKDHDVVNRRDATHHIMEHTTTSVHFHKIVLSPGEDEHVSNWREWTRQVLHDLEEAQTIDLHWYAVSHHHSEHPHVHVVVAGAGYHQEKDQLQSITFSTKDYDMLRTSGREHSNHGFHHLIAKQFQALDALDHMIANHELEAEQLERESLDISFEDGEA